MTLTLHAKPGRPPEVHLLPCEFTGSIGAGRADITPPVGIYSRNWGSARHEVAEGVHRPLTATAIAFDGGAEHLVVLVSLDLSFWRSAAEERQLREAILKASGLGETELILHQTHSHSAPPTAVEFSSRPGGDKIGDFRRLIVARTCDAIRTSLARSRPAVLTWGRGSCRLAFDRHFQPAVNSPPLIGLNPQVAADDTVMIARVLDRESGKFVATLLNYACHPVSLGGSNRLISPDYVGAARETVERATTGAPCLFLQGASGDLTPRRSYEADAAAADQNGRELGYAALSALEAMLPPEHHLQFAGPEESGTTLALWRVHRVSDGNRTVMDRALVSTPLRTTAMPSRAELLSAISSAEDKAQRERLERRLLLRETIGEGNEFDFRFEITRLGQSFIVSTPAEPHSVFQVELRRRFPANAIAVANIANGYLSYLPPASDYSRGTYQTRVALFAEGSLERVLDAAADRIALMLGMPQGVTQTKSRQELS